MIDMILGFSIVILVLVMAIIIIWNIKTKKIKMLHDTISAKEIRIAILTKQAELLKLNIEKLKEYSIKDKAIMDKTNKILKVINDTEVDDEAKDKEVSSLLDSFLNN